MKIKVVIPWRANASRKSGFDWVCKYYEHRLGAGSVFVSPSPPGPFNRAAAINAGVQQFPNHIIVISDGDCFLCDHGLNRAIKEVDDQHLVIPHNYFVPSNVAQKRNLLLRDPAAPVRANWWKNRRSRRAAQSGIWVVTHEFFMNSPMDESFYGWGCEDTEYLARTHARRFSGPLYHIHHKRPSTRYFRRNQRLRRAKTKERGIKKNKTIDDLKEMIDGKSIALVGNGGSLRGSGKGKEIDSHDIVVRINNFVLRGFENDVGEKVSIWGSHFTGFAIRPVLHKDIKRHDCDLVLCTYPSFKGRKTDVHLITEIRHKLLPIDPQVHKELFLEYRNLILESGQPRPKADPSTGITLLYWLRKHLRMNVTTFGFDNFRRSVRHHYGDKKIRCRHSRPLERMMFERFSL